MGTTWRHGCALVLAQLALVGCSGDDDAAAVPATGGGGVGGAAGSGGVGGVGGAGGALDPWAEVGGVIEQRMADAHIPGLGVAVVADGQVLWSAGYGWANVQEQVPVTADTAFMLGSISKAVVAVALMQAAEEGVLLLDDDVEVHLPFPVDNPQVDNETIRVEHLVTHTSGIADNWGNVPYMYYPGDAPLALGDFLAGYLVAGGQWYDGDANYHGWEPGSQNAYSNIATALAGYVVELSTATAFDDRCDAEIFGPLQMTNTGWHLADFDPAQLATPHEWEPGTGEYAAVGHYGYPDYPDGQLRTSAADLGRLLAAITAGGQLDGVTLLEPSTVTEMLSAPLPGIDPTQFVFWYETTAASRPVIGHAGSDLGVGTDMFFDPETGVGVILLMNVTWSPAFWDVVDDLGTLLFDKAAEVRRGEPDLQEGD